MRISIDSTGSVHTMVVVESSLNNQEVEECIQNKIKHWVFPAPNGGSIVNVRIPFKFETPP